MEKRVLHGAHFQTMSLPDIINEDTEGETEMSEEVYNDDFLIDIPEIPMPDEKENNSEVVSDECEGAFKFAFIGAGQGGSRIAEAFWKLGYRRVCVINTTEQDMAGLVIPESNCLVIGDDSRTSGGAGKNPSKGEDAAKEYYEDIYDLMRSSFGRDFDRIFVCVGTGGGTGSGACPVLVDIAHDIAKSFKVEAEDTPPAVGVIASLPKVAEGNKVNANAYSTLNELFTKVGTDKGKMGGRTISPLIIVDNDRINKIYPNLPVSKFWGVANQSISSLFHLFNNVAVKDSEVTTFDRADFKDVLESGVVSFGACPIKDWSTSTSISHAVRDNLKRNVLVGGFDYKLAQTAACVFIANQSVLDEVPQEYLEHGFEMLSRIMQKNSVVHRGIYRGQKPGLVVYSILGELGRPDERMEEIAKAGGVFVKGK